MLAAEDGLRRLGCPKVNLQVRAENEPVVAFYLALGYSTEERVSMAKVLAGTRGSGPDEDESRGVDASDVGRREG